MKILGAGFPKTGTKSASEALKILGYKNAEEKDFTESLYDCWLKYLNNEISMKEVFLSYVDTGATFIQDRQSNWFWEELFNLDPNAKVILTVSDSDEICGKIF